MYRWQDLRFTFNPRRNEDILQAFGVKLAKERRNIGRRQQLVEFVFNGGLDVKICLLYTSDAADEEDSVDLGGRRIIKKKKKKKMEMKKSHFKRNLKQWHLAFSHGYSGS